MDNLSIIYPTIHDYYLTGLDITMIFEQTTLTMGELHGYIIGWYQGQPNIDMTRYIAENRRNGVGETYPHAIRRREYE